MNEQVYIETERLLLRQWKPADTEIYIAMNADKEVMEFFPSVLSTEQSLEHIERISKQIEEEGYGLFAMERKDNGAFIGFTGLSNPRFTEWFIPCIEIG
jgi:RimJ/RimL family protein N-acetyltransferase